MRKPCVLKIQHPKGLGNYGIEEPEMIEYKVPCSIGSYYNMHSHFSENSNLPSYTKNTQATITYNSKYFEDDSYPYSIVVDGEEYIISSYDTSKLPKLICTLTKVSPYNKEGGNVD